MTKNTKKIQRISSNWRIIIPHLEDYVGASPDQLHQLKNLILERLHRRPQDPRSSIKSEFQRGLRYYHIALEHHASGVPHLDILLVYDKSIKRQLTDFDYLYKHGDVTTYRKLNNAIIDYGKKEDKQSLSNFPENTQQVIQIQDLKKDPYLYLQKEMLNDPLKFNIQEYVRKHNLDPYITNWSSIKTKLKDMQVAAANLSLRNKPGFRLITPELIRDTLSDSEYVIYRRSQGIYDQVIAKLNEVVKYKFERPFKSKQLLLVGPPDTGKTSLIRQIQKHCAVYHMDVSNWFPAYRDQVYGVIAWNQFKLKGGMTHTDLLKFLEGYPMDLEYKGGSSLRRDNQLIIMTSNMTLQQHINLKFKDNHQKDLAKANLKSRIEEIILPKDVDLFLLQNLIQRGSL